MGTSNRSILVCIGQIGQLTKNGETIDGLQNGPGPAANHEVKITQPSLQMDPFHAPVVAVVVAATAYVGVAAEAID